MEKIIQLKESEYNELFESAKLNQAEIELLAKKMYEEKGVLEINLEIDCNQEYKEQVAFKAYSYVKDWNGKFPLSNDDKRKIVKFVNYRALEMMEKKFGRQIRNINIWNKRVDVLRSWKIKFIGWMIFGWIAALALLVIALIK